VIPYAMHEVTSDDLQDVRSVLESDRLAQGPVACEFEGDLCKLTGVSDAVCTSSGTAALHTALAALGVGPGDEVVVPSLTFLATANAVLLCGAKPVFAEVDRESLCLAPEALAAVTNARTRGAIAVHYAGHPAACDEIQAALGSGRFVLEDACHALGASREGRAVGGLGDAACFSFHPAKHVTTGEGGAVVTGSSDLARRARRFREHGVERDPTRFAGLGLPSEWAEEERGEWVYEMHDLAPNYRMPELSAALGRSQLRRLGVNLQRRRRLAEAYADAFADCDAFELPSEAEGVRSAWHLYPIRLRLEALRCKRAEFFSAFRAQGVGVQVHYIPVHLQPFYRRRLSTAFGDLPVTEQESMRLISLPIFPALACADHARVIEIALALAQRYRR